MCVCVRARVCAPVCACVSGFDYNGLGIYMCGEGRAGFKCREGIIVSVCMLNRCVCRRGGGGGGGGAYGNGKV